jgi:hypothetical protein
MTVLRTNLTTEDTENTEKGIEATYTLSNSARGIVLKMPTGLLKNSDTAKSLEPHSSRLYGEIRR